MRKDIPLIHEDADTLKQQFTAERHPVKRQRLHMLYLLASRQVPSPVSHHFSSRRWKASAAQPPRDSKNTTDHAHVLTVRVHSGGLESPASAKW